MAIIRGSRPEIEFTIFHNSLLNDSALSAENLGVLVYLLSKPENWRVMPAELAKRFGCGRDRIYRIMRELIEAGYIARLQSRDGDGSFGDQSYVVSETKSPLPENTDADEPLPEKPTLQRTESTKDGRDSPAKPQERKRKAKGIEYTEQFEQLVWGPYPRKEGTSKKNAFEKFRWLPETDQQLVIKTIPAYAKLKAGKDPEHIHHLEFFLSKRIFDTISVSKLVAQAGNGTAEPSYQTFNHRQWEKVLEIWRTDHVWRDIWGPAPGTAASRVPVELLWPHELSQRQVDRAS